jgi:5-formyltetrahydrofolate cyclo-ligase
MSAVSEEKARLRAERLAALRASPATAADSEAIAAQLVALPAFATARCVVLYAALPGEPDLAAVWEAASGKRILCPAAGEGGPELRSVATLGAMARTRRGFHEPPAGAQVDPSLPDLWVVPGLSFDAFGVRLGRGGGYYDRLLAQRSPQAVVAGVALERWVTERLPREAHDALVTVLATERSVRPVRL